jgi:hypothetical protein
LSDLSELVEREPANLGEGDSFLLGELSVWSVSFPRAGVSDGIDVDGYARAFLLPSFFSCSFSRLDAPSSAVDVIGNVGALRAGVVPEWKRPDGS